MGGIHGCQPGVVGDSIDCATVNVLGADGKTRAYSLKELRFAASACCAHSAVEVGDLVSLGGHKDLFLPQDSAVLEELVGMVVHKDSSGVCVRFRDELFGCDDCKELVFDEATIQRDDSADC